MTLLALCALLACQVRALSDLPDPTLEVADEDADGHALPADCDDHDPTVHPGAPEQLADGVDQDCDGLDACPQDADGDRYGGTTTVLVPLRPGCGEVAGSALARDDCDDADRTTGPPRTWFLDRDDDGHGTPGTATEACAALPGWSTTADDCDDDDPLVHPGTLDAPGDGVDADCDGADPCWLDGDGDGIGGPIVVSGTPEGCPAGATAAGGDCDDASQDVGLRIWHPDQDGDGRGDPGVGHVACRAPSGWVASEDDCDDADPLLPRAWYADLDGDGHGDPLAYQLACVAPAGSLATSGDCDDADEGVHPGAPETCDGRDEDCDGRLDDADPDVRGTLAAWVDADGDGWGAGAAVQVCGARAGLALRAGDCDDDRASVAPDAPEVPYDGVDQDCDGRDLVDVDADGHAGGPGGPDCDDGDPDAHPGAREQCGDGIDQDCVPQSPACLLPATLVPAESDARLVLVSDTPELLGWSLAAADLTGDGVPDLAAGAPGSLEDATASGSIYVFDGSRLLPGRTDSTAAHARYRGLTSAHAGVSLGAGPGALWMGGPTWGSGGGYLARIPLPTTPGTHTSASYDEVAGGAGRQGLGWQVAVDPVGGTALATESAGRPWARAWAVPADAPAAFRDLDQGTGAGRTWSLGTATGHVTAVATGPDPLALRGSGWAVGWVTSAGTVAVRAGSGAPPPFVDDLGPNTTPPPDSALLIASGRDDQALLALALAPDLTGDGRPDLVVGMSCARTPCDAPDEVLVVPGPLVAGEARIVRLDDPAPATRLGASEAGTLYPWSIAAGGDVDGDGAPDLLLGAGSHEAGRGRSWLLYGPLPQGDLALSRVGVDLPGTRWTSGGATLLLGRAVATLGDLDGDGRDELALAAPFAAGAHLSASAPLAAGGIVHIWRGRGE